MYIPFSQLYRSTTPLTLFRREEHQDLFSTQQSSPKPPHPESIQTNPQTQNHHQPRRIIPTDTSRSLHHPPPNGCISIMAIRLIQRNRSRNRSILQAHPRMDLISQSPFLQKNLPRSALCIAIPSIPSVSTITHDDPVTGKILIKQSAIPFETPIESVLKPKSLERQNRTNHSHGHDH